MEPLSADNPLIFSAGPFAGTNFSNANRTSVGCKSPLTGGIKEANAGGTFGVALGQLHIAGLTLHGACEEWTVIHLAKDGSVSFDDAQDYLGLGNFDAAERLHERYGKKVSLALCGPVGEYRGLARGHRHQRCGPAPQPPRRARRGGRGHGGQEGQGDRRRPPPDADPAGTQEGDGRDQGVRAQAARRRPGGGLQEHRHREHGRLHQLHRRPAGAQFQLRAPHGERRAPEARRRLPARAQHGARGSERPRLHAGLHHRVQQCVRRRRGQRDRLARRVRDHRPHGLELRAPRPRRARPGERGGERLWASTPSRPARPSGC